MRHQALATMALLAALTLGTSAQAQEGKDWTKENFGFQFGVGTYKPQATPDVFGLLFGNDRGPLVNFEFDIYAYHIPYVGPIGLGGAFGWAKYTGDACVAGDMTCSMHTTEKVKVNLFPVTAYALLRLDTLARHTPVPLVFTGKIGYDSVFFVAKKNNSTEGKGRSSGLRWAAQVAIELNQLSPKRARALDDDWGINSTNLFFEMFGSDANSKLPLGDKFAWMAGLGLTF